MPKPIMKHEHAKFLKLQQQPECHAEAERLLSEPDGPLFNTVDGPEELIALTVLTSRVNRDEGTEIEALFEARDEDGTTGYILFEAEMPFEDREFYARRSATSENLVEAFDHMDLLDAAWCAGGMEAESKEWDADTLALKKRCVHKSCDDNLS